ncbi:type II secretion system minor pseudopilin GspI [Pseudomarimonas salicorniae]|uniref:Type II secretion system protein I n=1 Tax=Pseudomarimonas salicorniae TaxID=2933270 RepID=A0ABT0GDZ7_9GAMM|nr:type II secretion system minor pseudopilin GspI [Lysobacter sp. CAU 1642]MCK7592779.1 type II secretion system minor pseudopilin GspI [Lysobacter sp. CAU 1642]
MNRSRPVKSLARRSRGFTLLEVLVALLLLSLAMVALVRSVGQEASALGQQREATLAQWVAANRLAELRLARDLPRSGQAQGRSRLGGRDWRWQLDARATDTPGLLQVELRVYDEGADAALPAATLLGFYRQ